VDSSTVEIDPSMNTESAVEGLGETQEPRAAETVTAAVSEETHVVVTNKRSSAVLNNVNPELLKCLNGIFAGPGSGTNPSVMRPLPNTRSRQTTAGTHRAATRATITLDGSSKNEGEGKQMVPHPIKRTKSRLLRVSRKTRQQ